MLRGPNWNLMFHISTYASNSTLGVVLGQKDDTLKYSIYYICKKRTPTELNCTVNKKKFLVVIHSINKFRHYITSYEIFVHIDHSTIRYLMNK